MTPFTVLAEAPAPAPASFRFLAQTPAPAPAPGAPPAGQPQGNPLTSLALPLLVIGVFFIFIIGPQNKRAKEHKKLLAGLKSGDDIVTSGGLHGTIAQVKPDVFVVEIAKGVRVEINRANVEGRAPGAIVEDASGPKA